jgi:hypothetical protein
LFGNDQFQKKSSPREKQISLKFVMLTKWLSGKLSIRNYSSYKLGRNWIWQSTSKSIISISIWLLMKIPLMKEYYINIIIFPRCTLQL